MIFGEFISSVSHKVCAWLVSVNMAGRALSMHKAQNIATEWSGAAGLSSLTNHWIPFEDIFPLQHTTTLFAFASKF